MRVASSGASASRISRRMLAIGIGSVVVALVVLGSAATVYTDSLWFRELKSGAVFWTQIWTKLGLAAAFGTIFAVLLLLNLWIAQKITSPTHVFTMRDQMIERYRMMLQPYVRRLVVGGVILFGIFAGSSASGQWRNWLLFRNAETFGQTDPVFGKDLGFFVFKLPFHQFLFTWGFSSLLVITLIVAGAHYLMGGIRTEGAPPRVAPHVKAHLSVLLGLVVASKAWAYRLDQFNLLYSPRGGQVTGASYTDVNAQLPALKLLVVIALVCAILFLVNIRFRGWVLPAAGLGILIITSIIAGGIYPATVQRLRVNPQERDRERPYIERNIQATRAAFGLSDEDVAVRSLPAGGVLTPAILKDNQATVENLRMWDPKVLVKAYTQLQRITPYYEFLDVDVDRYPIGGRPRQVMLSAREMAPSGLPPGARTWVNNHLIYTHGFGMVASRVDQATSEGQPQFIVSDIPAKETSGAPKITEPRIYFGESEEQAFVVVRSANKELDFPEGQTGFKSTTYEGTGGVQLSGFLRRAAFAWRFRDPNLLISGAITGKSRIMFNRQVAARVRRVAPFVQLDADPYLTVVKGKLVWVQDAYTTTPNYPYAQRVNMAQLTDGHLTGAANYIRNSIKATVDALNGTVTLYLWDPTDPIARAWNRVFPGLIRPADEMDPELRAHVRYPEDLFRVQADRYATYHITDPIDFYSKNDVWRIPQDPTATDGSSLPPYYVLMRLPGEDKPEFVLMLPFSPFSGEGSNATRRQNMTSWLAARMDGDQYGNLVSFQYSKETLVFGPEQVATRINNDQNVRNVISALDPREERIRWGNLLVVPIEDAVLYVRPLYLESPESSLPEFKRVVIVTGDRIRISETIEGALAALFGEQPPGTPDAPAGETVADLIAEAMEHFRLADQALRAGDFARFGREQAAGREALAEAAKLSGAAEPEPTGSPSPSPSQ